MCSCGVINKHLKLSDREWTCLTCGSVNDRDILAANNIKNFGLMKLNYTTTQVMGGESADILRNKMDDAEILVNNREITQLTFKDIAGLL
jgi:hypothetical protein